ncbi:hypothetical protein ACFQ9X_47270 [Catenulispora yoronensis]
MIEYVKPDGGGGEAGDGAVGAVGDGGDAEAAGAAAGEGVELSGEGVTVDESVTAEEDSE